MPDRVDPLDERTHHGQVSRALRAARGPGRLRALLRGHPHRARAEHPGPAAVRSRSGLRRRTAARSPTNASPSSRSRTWTRCRRASDPRRGRRPSTTSRTSPPAASRSSSPRSTDPSARRSRSVVTAFRRRARRLALKASPEGRAVDRPSTRSATRTSRGPGEGGNTGGWVNGPLHGRDRVLARTSCRWLPRSAAGSDLTQRSLRFSARPGSCYSRIAI
jgi:hypothetical protein